MTKSLNPKIKTVLHAYRFDISNLDEKKEYLALEKKLKALGLKCFESHGGGSHYSFVSDLNGKKIELETNQLFGNQWNTAPIKGKSDKGLRVFDWAQDYCTGSGMGLALHIKRGHWLEQTEEMKEVRCNTVACGYCGKQEPAAKGYVFCPHCLASEYLTPEQLHLTRMIPIKNEKRAKLSDVEKEYLLPLYNAAQLAGKGARSIAYKKKQREDLDKNFLKQKTNLENEYAGFTWLLDNDMNIDNVIYYDHKGVFSWGWRSPLSDDLVKLVLEKISEFPFQYEIKCANGKVLSN